MKTIPFDQLNISERRQRRTFDQKTLDELAKSIMNKGLMHPLVVSVSDEGLALVAGERRSRAIRSLAEIGVSIRCNDEDIPLGHFPYILLGELSHFALKEAELEENILRDPLTWQEQAEAVADLDALRREQKAEIGERHTTKATASEIIGREAAGSEITRVADALVVAKHLDDPDVAKAKSPKEAMKVIRRKAEDAHRAVLAEQFDLTKTPHTALLGSCFDLAKQLPGATFDVLITDPPYGIDANNFGDMASTEHKYEDSYEYAMKCYKLTAEEGFRVTRPQAHAYVFLDPRYWSEISLIFLAAGWDVWPIPLIWDKSNGMLPKPEYGPRRTYEMILFANKGNRKVLKVGPDVVRYPLEADRAHGAQKPVPLYEDLLSRSCYPGQHVVDFFSGSGTIFPAANKLKLIATGFEQVESSYNLGVSRLLATGEAESLSSLLPFGV